MAPRCRAWFHQPGQAASGRHRPDLRAQAVGSPAPAHAGGPDSDDGAVERAVGERFGEVLDRDRVAPARSAIVRATLSTRSWARAENPSRAAARSRRPCPAGGSAQWRRSCRGVSRAFTRTVPRSSRARWRSRARATRCWTAADSGGAPSCGAAPAGATGPTSTCRSIRSRSGAESRPRYRARSPGVHAHPSALRQPRRHGFIAPTNWTSAGSRTAPRPARSSPHRPPAADGACRARAGRTPAARPGTAPRGTSG